MHTTWKKEQTRGKACEHGHACDNMRPSSGGGRQKKAQEGSGGHREANLRKPPLLEAFVHEAGRQVADGLRARQHLCPQRAGVWCRQRRAFCHFERLQEQLGGRDEGRVEAQCEVEVFHDRRRAVPVQFLLQPARREEQLSARTLRH